MKLTKFETYKRNKMLWMWLAQHPDKDKEDCPYWKENGGKWVAQVCLCWLCGYYTQLGSCRSCPLYRQSDNMGCADYNSIYIKWMKATAPKLRTKYALMIANIKEGDHGKD